MRSWAVDRAKRRVVREARSTLVGVVALPEQGLFNQQCHRNCVEYVRRRPGRDLGVVEVMQVWDQDPILHYLVHDREAGTYLEVTLGYQAEGMEYYLVRPVDPRDYDRIGNEFERSNRYWAERSVHPLLRWLLRIDRVT